MAGLFICELSGYEINVLMKSSAVSSYIKAFPESTQAMLQELRQLIFDLAPNAEETISYGIPTYKLNKVIIHFGGFNNHIGLYPGATAVALFKGKLMGYKTTKGAITFPLSRRLPLDLIKEIIQYKIKEITKK